MYLVGLVSLKACRRVSSRPSRLVGVYLIGLVGLKACIYSFLLDFRKFQPNIQVYFKDNYLGYFFFTYEPRQVSTQKREHFNQGVYLNVPV